MTKKDLTKKIADIVWDTEVQTTEEGWIMNDAAMETAEKIVKLLGTVYELREILR